MKKNFLLFFFICCCFQQVLGAYVPVPVTSGFNADLIANGLGDASSSATSFDVPNNYAFLSADFLPTAGSSPATYALPSNGLISSITTSGLAFQIADYSGNNSLFLNSSNATGTLAFSATGIADIYLLTSAANGDANFDAIVHFSDGSSQNFNSLTSSDWYNGSDFAIKGIGRVSLINNSLEGNADNPRLYQVALHLDAANYTKTITNIAFNTALSSGSSMAILGVTTNSACTGSPAVATTIASSVNACSGVDLTLSLSGYAADGGMLYQWATSPDNAAWTPVASGGADPVYTAQQTAATYYHCNITCVSTGLFSVSSSLLIGQNPANQCYCIPAYYEGCSDIFGNYYDIDGVQLSGENGTAINNSGTGCAATNAYSDYSSSVSPVSILPFSNYILTISSSSPNASGNLWATTWIDLNDDGSFDDNTERVGTTGSNSALSMTINTTTLNAGLHRMRVRTVWYNYDVVDDPCASYYNGETEDYMVNILPAPSCIQPLNITTVDNANGTSSDVSWTGNVGNTYDYAVDQTSTANPDVATTFMNTGNNTVNIPNLTPNTLYYFHTRSHCSATDSSIWVVKPFAISSTCANATQISIGSVVTGNSAPYPDAILPADNSCSSSSGAYYHGAWFKVSPTTSGTIAVTTNNSSYDTYLRIYSGDCATLLCEGYNDDYSGSTSYLSFSANANTTYYILMTGYYSYSGDDYILQTSFLPENDEADNAVGLTPGAGCTGYAYSTLGATASANEPYPSCSGNNAIAAVWFKFIAPSGGTAKITTDYSDTGISDTRLGLFEVADSSDYSTFNLIGCDDNNGISGNGNLSTIYATGLTPGNTYYVEVDNGNYMDVGGAFCISVSEINPTMLSSAAVSCGNLQIPAGNDNLYTGWISLSDDNGNLVALVKNPAGSYPSDFSGAYTVNGSGIRQDGNGTYYLNRNYFINNPLISTPVAVQLFFTPGEYNYLNGITGAAGAAVTMNDLNVTKQEGSSCAADYSQSLGPVSVLTQTANNTINSVGWIQVNTSSFSNFYIMGGTTPLLITLKDIAAENLGSFNKVSWSTATESAGDYFELERSADGKTFNFIAKVNGNQKAAGYIYDDKDPLPNTNYYRLKMISANSKAFYSKVVEATVSGQREATVELYPNPTDKNVTLKVTNGVQGFVSLTDLSGRVIYQTKMTMDTLQLDLGGLSNGIYLIHYVDGNLNKVIKVNKQ